MTALSSAYNSAPDLPATGFDARLFVILAVAMILVGVITYFTASR